MSRIFPVRHAKSKSPTSWSKSSSRSSSKNLQGWSRKQFPINSKLKSPTWSWSAYLRLWLFDGEVGCSVGGVNRALNFTLSHSTFQMFVVDGAMCLSHLRSYFGCSDSNDCCRVLNYICESLFATHKYRANHFPQPPSTSSTSQKRQQLVKRKKPEWVFCVKEQNSMKITTVTSMNIQSYWHITRIVCLWAVVVFCTCWHVCLWKILEPTGMFVTF